MGSVLVINIALASIALFICVMQLFMSSRKNRDLLFLVGAVLSMVVFIAFSFSIIFTSSSIVSSTPLGILRYQLVFTVTIFLCMLGVIFHMLNDGRKLYILLNSSIFWLLIAFSIIVPDYVLFGESAITHKIHLPSDDSILLIRAGFTVWRAMVDLTIIIFAASAILLLTRNHNYLTVLTRAFLYSGLGIIIFTGIYDQLVDLGWIQSVYVLQFAGYTFYLLLSFIPFYNFVRVVNTHHYHIERDKKWQSLVSHADLLAVGLNRMGHVEFLSPYFYELTGYTPEEVLGKDWFEFIIPPKEFYNVQGAFVEVLSYEFHPHYMNPILTKNKEERMIRWYNVRTRDQAGIITGSLSIGVDVSDDIKEKESIRKKLKEAEDIILHLNEKIESH